MNKGISDFYTSEDLADKQCIMKQIEDRIHKVEKYRFGYEGSEALITLIKTPNNTFPVFWKDYKTKDGDIKAPFSRF